MRQEVLLTPGPTPVPPEVLARFAEPIFHHRTERFQKIFASVSERLKPVFRTQCPVYVLTGSGTLAMEAAVTNFFSPDDTVLTVSAGKFGERWTELANAFGLKAVELKAPYGEVVAAAAVEEALKANPQIRGVFSTLCETSTGVVFDIAGIAKATRGRDVLLVVDAISGLAADRLETDAWGVDVVVSGSQKGLMIPPGLAFISVNEKAKRFMERARLPRYYVDLRFYERAAKDNDTPFTPALTLIVGLDEALKRIEKVGLEALLSDQELHAGAVRRAAKALGLELFAKHPSCGVTALTVPPQVDGSKLVKIMAERHGVRAAGGQGEMKGKLVRIAHMGFIQRHDLEQGLEALEQGLIGLGYPARRGAGLEAFRQALAGATLKADAGKVPQGGTR